MTRRLLMWTITLASLLFAAGGARALVESFTGPVSEADLRIAGGPLVFVGPCSTGRNARFSYRVQAPQGAVESSLTCPNPLQLELSQRVGQTVMLKYKVDAAGPLASSLPGVLRVYEFRIDNGSLWSLEETNEQLQSTRWLRSGMALLAIVAGLLVARLAWRHAQP